MSNENLANATGHPVTGVDVGISPRAVRLGRMVDRLPAGRHIVILSVNPDKALNVEIIGEETWRKISALLE